MKFSPFFTRRSIAPEFVHGLSLSLNTFLYPFDYLYHLIVFFFLFFRFSELLDEAEFGETSTKSEYDENDINPALELGFLVVKSMSLD